MLYLPFVSNREPARTDAEGEHLDEPQGLKESAHGGDAIGRKAYAFGVLLDGRLVRGEIDAVHFVAGYVAMEPLDLGTHCFQNTDRLLRDFPQLGVG